MGKLKHIVSLSLALATLVSIQNVLGHTIHKKSILSWLRDDDSEQQKVENIVHGYKPILEVHKYNGLQINPINGGPPVFFESGAPIGLEQLTAGSDQQIANLLYNAVPFLPEEERMHEVNMGAIGPYVQMIPEASIDRLRVTFESDGEERVGSQGKSKLLKLLQVIKEKKLKPLKALYEKKKDVIQSAMNFLKPSPPPPHPVPVFPLPPPPPPASDTVIVPASPSFFAFPPPQVFSHSSPPLHLLQPLSSPEVEFLKFTLPSKHEHSSSIMQGAYFEHPPKAPEFHHTDHVFSEVRLGGADKKDPCAPKDTKCEEHHYATVFPEKSFNAPTAHGAAPFFHSLNVDHVPPPPPPPPPSFFLPLAPSPVSDEHHHTMHAYPPMEEGPHHFDLLTSESENVEKFSQPVTPVRAEFVDERTNVLQPPRSGILTVAPSTTPQATLQSEKGTESSSPSSSTVSPSI